MVTWKEAWCPTVTLVESPSLEPSVKPEIQACIGLSYDPSKCETECYAPDWLGSIFVYGKISLYCSGDINGNGVVDEYDLNYVLEGIRLGQYCKSADLNRDGVVDEKDYEIVLRNLGENVQNKPIVVRWLLDPAGVGVFWAFNAKTDQDGKFVVEIKCPELIAFFTQALIEWIFFPTEAPYPTPVQVPLFFDVMVVGGAEETKNWKTAKSDVLVAKVPPIAVRV